MWLNDPYEVEWLLTRSADRIASAADRRALSASRTRPPVGRAQRLGLALRVLVDEAVAWQVADTLTCQCEQSGA